MVPPPPPPNNPINPAEKGDLNVQTEFPPLCPEEAPLFRALCQKIPGMRPGIGSVNNVHIRDGHIHFLSIWDMTLPAFPPEILGFSHMVKLSIAGSQLTSIPPSLFSLPKLRNLTLIGRGLELPAIPKGNSPIEILELRVKLPKILPASLYSLSEIRTLRLYISEPLSIGVEISTFPHLTYLEIYSSEQDEKYGNRLRLPQNFGELPALRGLKIASSIQVAFEAGGKLPLSLILLEINDIHWATFQNGKKLPKGKDTTAKAMFTDCQNLRRVIITRSEQAEAHILGLAPLPRLEYLRLSFSDTSGFPLALQHSPYLTTLYLSNNQSLNMSAPLAPSGFPALRHLTVIQPYVSNLTPDLQAWQRLESLHWSGPQFDEVLAKVGSFPHLKNLSLHNLDLNVLPESICQLTALQSLSLSHCRLLRLPKCIHRLKGLSLLNLQHNDLQIVPPPLQELVSLQELNLLGNPLKKLPAWLLNLPKLHLIWIPSNPDLLNDRESVEIIEALRVKGVLKI